ncbi:cobalamin synthesis protein P47K [Niabella ginsenosidivorans]|uniref:Cobalamin synthesis protein P47K n=1 Tax=Niabella ginsenosidivorans TaxID=1176587 RepID=A0A1A9I2M8_9BACT|nr:GTP-binding protein [Niabella ginsenosidivorans]ANH81783.1 cobalamin synthesis protein P47K [Niabella ginsenosidivorans]
MKRTRLIFVGGFLGAGKTTLLQQASALFTAEGASVGLITNDQAEELVDTHFLAKNNTVIKEVSGSCFCCNYSGFIDVVNSLMDYKGTIDVIIAEPVGSCTDISATILQPLKEQMRAVVDMAPFTVVADPGKLENILDGGTAGMHPSAAYIYRQQLEESDVLLVSKTDTIAPERLGVLTEKLKLMYPEQQVLTMSARNGTGVKEWMEYVCGSSVSGSRIIDVDYDRYAEGEAVMGWLNASVLLQGKGVDWDLLLKRYFQQLNSLLGRGMAIGHIKILIECTGNDYIIGNQTGPLHTLQFSSSAGTGNIAGMTINARVETDPGKLKELVFEALAQTIDEDLFYEIRQCKAFSPGYPRPQHKYRYVVA